MNKIISFLVSLVFWLLLIALQTYTIAYQGNVANAFAAPELYYSVWIVDLYLILLYYLNYYVIAPLMIRRRLFRPYIYIIIVAMLLGFLIPVALFYAHGLTTPDTAPGQTPISLIGIVGALGVIAVGLALRSVSEWAKLESNKKELKQHLATIDKQKTEIETLKKEVLEHQATQTSLEERIKDLEKHYDAYRNIYGALSESEFNAEQ